MSAFIKQISFVIDTTQYCGPHMITRITFNPCKFNACMLMLSHALQIINTVLLP